MSSQQLGMSLMFLENEVIHHKPSNIHDVGFRSCGILA